MQGKQRAGELFKDYSQRKVSKAQTYSGVLGIVTNGEATVKVTGRNNFVWVRLRNATNEVIQAFNDAVSNTYDLPVLVQYDPANPVRYRIIGRDVGRYSDWGWRGTQLPPHGGSHSFTFDNSGGGDMVWVYSRQIMPYLIAPSGSVGQLGAVLYPHYYYDADTFRWFGATGTPNLSPYKPTNDQARMVLLVLDTDSGNVYVATGTSSDFTATITGNALVAQYIPPLPDNNDIPLAAVRLLSGTSTIQWANIYDVRPFFYPPSVASSAPSTAQYVVMALNGSLSNERVLVSGSDIKITDEGANANVIISVATGVFSRTDHTHPGGSGDNVLPIYDDNVFKVTGTILDFTNDLNVIVTGTVGYIGIPTGTFSRPGDHAHTFDRTLLLYDDSIFKVTGTAISFDNDILLVVTGSVGYASIPTGTFSRPGDHTHLSSDNHDVVIYDDHVFKVTGTVLDFVEDLDVVVTGTTAYIYTSTGTFSRANHTHPSSDSHDVVVYDDGVFKVTGTIIDFSEDLNVSVTGSTAYAYVSTGTFSRANHVHPSSDSHDVVIHDNGVFKVTGTVIDFAEDLDVTITGTSAYVNVSTGTFSRANHTHLSSDAHDVSIYDDHVFKVTGTAIDFVDDLNVATTGTFAYVSIPTGTFSRPTHIHPSSDNHDVAIYDNGTFKATGTIIDFGENLAVSVTGTSVFVDATVGGGTITGSGTVNRIAKFTSNTTIGNSNISDDGSTVTVTGTNVNIVNGGNFYAAPIGNVTLSPHTDVSLSPSSDVYIFPSGTVDISRAYEGVNIHPIGNTYINPSGSVYFQGNGNVELSNNGYIDMYPQGTIALHPLAGNVDIYPAGYVDIRPSGSTIIHPKTDVNIYPNGDLYINPNGNIYEYPSGSVNIYPSQSVDIYPKYNVDIHPGNIVSIHSTGSVEIYPNADVGIRPIGDIYIWPSGSMYVYPKGDIDIHPGGNVLIHPTGSVSIYPNGNVTINPIGNTYISPSGSVYFQGNGNIDFANAGNANIHPAGYVWIHPTGNVDIQPVQPVYIHSTAGTVEIFPTTNVNIYPSGSANIYPDGNVNMYPDGNVIIYPANNVYINPNVSIVMQPNSNVEMLPSGSVNIYPKSNVDIHPGGNVTIHPTGSASIYPNGNLDIYPTGYVEINPSGSVGIHPNGNVDIHPLGEVTVDAANSITLQQDTYVEENLYVSGSVFTDSFTDYSSISQIVGWASFTTQQIYYMKIGKLVIVEVSLAGLSNDTRTNFTVPYAPSTVLCNPVIKIQDNGSNAFGHIALLPSSVTGTCYPTASYTAASWTNTGTKLVRGTLVYITD